MDMKKPSFAVRNVCAPIDMLAGSRPVVFRRSGAYEDKSIERWQAGLTGAISPIRGSAESLN